MKNGKRILFIEPMGDYKAIVSAIRLGKRLPNGSVFLPSKKHQKTFLKFAEQENINCENNLLSYSTIDHDYDDELYEASMELSVLLVNIIKSCSSGLFQDRNYYIDEDGTRAAEVYFHDQFAGHIRTYLNLNKHIVENKVEELIYIPRPGPHWLDTYKYLQAFYPNLDVKIFRNHWLRGHLSRFTGRQAIDEYFTNINVNRRPTLPHYRKFKDPNIFFCTNLVASQFRESTIPLLEGLLQKSNVTCYNFAGSISPEAIDDIASNFKDMPFRLSIIQREKEHKKKKLDNAEISFIKILVKRFSEGVAQRGDDYRLYHDILKTLLQMRVLPFLLDLKAQQKSLSAITINSSLVVVVPGRSSDAILATAIAKSRGTPSIEIQSGVISKFKRFVKPNAQEVIAIEPYGSSVYTDFLGVPPDNVHVLGGIKLELDTRPYREISKKKVMAELKEHGVNPRLKTILLATQPIGVDHASSIVEVALKAIKGHKNLQLVIKPHPSEDETYHLAYENLAKKNEVTNFKILKNFPIMPVVIASDMVMTYFSTVGLEAFSLHRPVICINPFSTRPPVDLVELGVASEVRTAKDLDSILTHYFSNDTGATIHDPLLDRLRDGRSIMRIQEHILQRASL